MTMSKETRGLRESVGAVLTAKRRQAGTSLVEILVVIVIFLIGILAVVQVFPRGFRILLTSRNNSVATALGRAEVERLKERPDLLPEQVLAVRYPGGANTAQIDETKNPLSLDPLGDSIGATGRLSAGGSAVADDWKLAAGPNVARRIIGEGQRVPAPRQVGIHFGGLMVLEHGPVDPGKNTADPTYPNIVAYGNDLSRTVGAPRETTQSLPPAPDFASVPGGGNVANVTLVSTPVTTAPFEFFAVDPATPDASILVPTSEYPRIYRIRLSGYVGASGSYRRVDYVSLAVAIQPVTLIQKRQFPLVRVRLDDLLTATPLSKDAGDSLLSTEVGTIQVAPRYRLISTNNAFSGDPSDPVNPGDPFEMKILNPNLGVLLFSPAAREGVVSRPGGASEPLLARVDYDVLDWRILREEFRVVGDKASFPLALQSIKVGTQAGPDGQPNGPIQTLENGTSATDNLAIVDLTTGFLLDEANNSITVDKSRGLVTINNFRLITPNGSTQVVANNRTVRVLYRARNEWSVQMVKGASQYSIIRSGTPVQGQCIVSPTQGAASVRIYFPKSDANRKVTIDRIVYFDTSSNSVQTLEGQDFVIRPSGTTAPSDLPYVDLTEVVPASTLRFDFGDPVQGVKGASVAVRVLWNPEAFNLTTDGIANLDRAGVWARGWRKSMTETYLRAEETR